jgi:predicted ATP-grasp superfamily ATP-dependent carboligase
LPTCDDTAWFYAKHQKELSRYFHVDPTPVESVYALLNKRRLAESCTKAGISVPATEGVDSVADIHRIASDAAFPLLIKPTTQVFFKSREKGEIVSTRNEFVRAYRTFASLDYGVPLASFDPSATRPIVQEFHSNAGDCIYNLSGYVDETGEVSAFRASTKVLQLRKIGTGVCFESAEVQEPLTEGVRELFRQVGYRGIFEIEFIRTGSDYLLIDANPRFYGEMAFEIERGMPLPLFAYFQALGDTDTVRSLARSSATSEGPRSPRAHSHRFAFQTMLRLQQFAGALSDADADAWRNWLTEAGDRCSDSVIDKHDVVPSVVDTALVLYGYLRYPTEILRTTVEHRLGKGTRRPRAVSGAPRSMRPPAPEHRTDRSAASQV